MRRPQAREVAVEEGRWSQVPEEWQSYGRDVGGTDRGEPRTAPGMLPRETAALALS